MTLETDKGLKVLGTLCRIQHFSCPETKKYYICASFLRKKTNNVNISCKKENF